MNRVYIQDVGINNVLGNSLTVVAENLFSQTRPVLTEYDDLISGGSCYVGRVKSELPEIPSSLRHFSCRNNQLLLQAYNQIESKTRELINKHSPKRFAIILGTSTSGIEEGEKAYKRANSEFDYRRQEIGNISQFLSSYIGAEGISYTLSTACSSSGRALITAYRLLKEGLCDVVIAGGSDSLCDLTLNGFDSLDSVSLNICNPMSVNRHGISIGEGAAVFLLSRDPAKIELKGVGESSDGYHISAPDPNAIGAEIAVREALKSANLTEVGYINLHGTGTKKNDAMEAKLIHRVFGGNTPASSTKPLLGHTLGASAAQELALCYITLSESLNPEQLLPPHIWDGHYDPELDQIRLVNGGETWTKSSAMSNSFAFGGNNVSLVLERN